MLRSPKKRVSPILSHRATNIGHNYKTIELIRLVRFNRDYIEMRYIQIKSTHSK